MSREFVDAIVDGNNIGAEEVFKTTVGAKVGDALELRRKEPNSPTDSTTNYLILRSQKLRNGDFFNKLGIWCECAVVGHSRQHKSFHYHATLDFRLVLRN